MTYEMTDVSTVTPKKIRTPATHLVVMAVVRHDIDRLDDVDVLQRPPNAKLRGNLLLVLPLGLTSPPWPELFDCVNGASVLRRRLDEAYSSASATAKRPPPFAVLFRKVRVGGFL